jgi:putative NADH-flavin reductase
LHFKVMATLTGYRIDCEAGKVSSSLSDALENLMKIALIGATGFVGTALVAELLQRGHQVTALARNPAKLGARPGLTAKSLDAYDADAVAAAVKGHDAVVSAFNPGWDDPALYDRFMQGSRAIEAGVEQSGVKRLLVVGGAGSLFVAPGVQLVDTPEFASHVPANVVPGAKAARDALTAMRGNTALDWTFLSPPALLAPGDRTGKYRVGGEELLMAGAAPAGIAVADLAVAIVDEIETPRHVRARFTVATA